MNKLKMGILTSLCPEFTEISDFMPMALIVENNGSSLKVMPVHNEPETANDRDIIISGQDSGLDFDFVAIPDQICTLPESALGKNQKVVSQSLCAWLFSHPQQPFSEHSGPALFMVPGSKPWSRRQAIIRNFHNRRFDSWNRYFIARASALPPEKQPESLAEICKRLSACSAVQKAPHPALAEKSSQLTQGQIKSGPAHENFQRQLYRTLARQCSATPQQLQLIEKGDPSEVVLLLLKLLSR